jgi:hypothetical protein
MKSELGFWEYSCHIITLYLGYILVCWPILEVSWVLEMLRTTVLQMPSIR